MGGGVKLQPRHFSAAPAHLPSPSRLFPFSPRGHQLQQSAEIFPRKGGRREREEEQGGRKIKEIDGRVQLVNI